MAAGALGRIHKYYYDAALELGCKLRKRLLISARSSHHFKPYVSSGLLERLTSEYDLLFLSLDSSLSTSEKLNEYDVSSYGVQAVSGIGPGMVGWAAKYRFKLNNLCYFLNEINQNRGWLASGYCIDKTLAVEGVRYVSIAKVLYAFGLVGVVGRMLRWLLRLSLPRYLASSGFIVPDLVLLSYNCYNISGYVDDVIRECRSLGVRTLGLQMNWDNIPDRIPLELPHFMGVFGEQAFICSMLYHHLPPYRIYPVGSINFDKYRSNMPDKSLARAALGLPNDARIIGILPTGERYDELFILSEISESIKTGKIPNDVYFYYKDYQYGRKDAMRLLSEAEGGEDKFEEILCGLSDRIIFFEPDQKKSLGDDAYYSNLMSALDAVASSFSTMALEAAYCGKPLMVFDYNPKDYGSTNYFDWSTAQYNVHLYAIRNSDAVILCDSRDAIVSCVNDLISRIDNKIIAEALKSLSKVCVYQGTGSAVDRIVDAVAHAMRNSHRDRSFNRYCNL